MTKELVISSNRHETKVAILEEDQLVEVYFQRAHEYSLAGSIHKGRRTRARGSPNPTPASDPPPPRHEPDPAAPVRQYVEPVRDTAVAPSGDTDFSVLPGESLAKYRGMNVPPLDEGEEREIQELQEPEIEGRSAAEEAADAA